MHGRSLFVESFVGKKKGEEEEKEKKRKRDREKVKKSKREIEKKSQNQRNPPDELSHHDSSKNPAGLNYSAVFLRKFRISPCFKLIGRFEIDVRAPPN